MRTKGSLTKGLLIALAFTLIPVSAISAKKITPGTTCKVMKQKVVFQNKTYTCIKSGKKLVWNKGVAIKNPTPTATPTATQTPTPTPTPTPTKIKPAPIKYRNCTEAKAAGVTPILRSTDPELYALNTPLDGDKDGDACES